MGGAGGRQPEAGSGEAARATADRRHQHRRGLLSGPEAAAVPSAGPAAAQQGARFGRGHCQRGHDHGQFHTEVHSD